MSLMAVDMASHISRESEFTGERLSTRVAIRSSMLVFTSAFSELSAALSVATLENSLDDAVMLWNVDVDTPFLLLVIIKFLNMVDHWFVSCFDVFSIDVNGICVTSR
jgi:hypothetical protein